MNYTLQPTQKDLNIKKVDKTLETIAFNPKLIAATGGLSAVAGFSNMIGNKLQESQVDNLGVGAETGRGKFSRGLGSILSLTSGFKTAANKDETTGRKILGAATLGIGTGILDFFGGGKRARGLQRDRLKKKRKDELDSTNVNNIVQQANTSYTAPQYTSYKSGGTMNFEDNNIYLTTQMIKMRVKLPKIDKEVYIFKKGGTLQNKISDGVSHGRKNNLHEKEEYKHLTKKGVPVITRDDMEQHAEIENNELILSKENNDKLIELSNYKTIEGAIKLGKWFKKQVLDNTEDSKSKLLK